MGRSKKKAPLEPNNHMLDFLDYDYYQYGNMQDCITDGWPEAGLQKVMLASVAPHRAQEMPGAIIRYPMSKDLKPVVVDIEAGYIDHLFHGCTPQTGFLVQKEGELSETMPCPCHVDGWDEACHPDYHTHWSSHWTQPAVPANFFAENIDGALGYPIWCAHDRVTSAGTRIAQCQYNGVPLRFFQCVVHAVADTRKRLGRDKGRTNSFGVKANTQKAYRSKDVTLLELLLVPTSLHMVGEPDPHCRVVSESIRTVLKKETHMSKYAEQDWRRIWDNSMSFLCDSDHIMCEPGHEEFKIQYQAGAPLAEKRPAALVRRPRLTPEQRLQKQIAVNKRKWLKLKSKKRLLRKPARAT